MFIVKEIKGIKKFTSIAPTYEVIGYTNTHAEAYKYCVNGKQYHTSDCGAIPPFQYMDQYLIEEIKPLIPRTSVQRFNPDDLEIVEIMVNLEDITPKDAVGSVFKNTDGVYNIPGTIEDVLKSNAWFGNVPIHLYLTIKKTPKVDEWGIDKNGIIRFYNNFTFPTSDVRKILLSTNKIIKQPFKKEMLDQIISTKDVKVLKTLFVDGEINKLNEEVKSMKQSIDKNYDDFTKTFNSLKTDTVKKTITDSYLNKKKTWTTFDGKAIDIETMDHQHLSNIYWYNLIVIGRPSEVAINELKKRFQGEILSYKPLLRFEYEINSLEKSGNLMWFDNETYSQGYVMYNDLIVGEIKKLK